MRSRGARVGLESRRPAAVIRVLASAVVCVSTAWAASAQPASIAELEAHGRAGAPGARRGFAVTPMPSVYGTDELRGLWQTGRNLELQERFLEAARLHEDLVASAPTDAYAYWKVSRNLWRHAETLPVDAKKERMALFERSDQWASKGLSIDPECAPCMLWKFGAMGRIATTRGVMKSLGMGREMKQLLDRGIALSPEFADTPVNSTLGNLYYASAVFHRVVPEWTWLEWVAGVKGDLDHSLEMIRRAVDLAPDRIDYLVEYGAVLHCYADRRDAPWAKEQASRALARATEAGPRIGTDMIDQQHARTLVADPSKACGYSRDGWIDTARRNVARAR